MVTLSAWRARLVQWLDIRRGTGLLARLFPVQLGHRPPRRPERLPAHVAELARPIRCPQIRRGTLVIDCLPHVDVPAFAQLLGRARRWQDVLLDLDEVGSGTAESVACLAAAGAQMRLPDSRPPLPGVHGELIEQLRSRPCHGSLDCELRSVRLRRAAHDQLWSTGSQPSVSVLLPSRRPGDIVFAIEQVRRQVGVDVQILVGLHGEGWPAEAQNRLSRVVPGLLAARFDAAVPFGSVLDELSARADGKLVTKWDDDDWYGIDHVADLVRAYNYSGADIVGKAAEFVRLEVTDVMIRRFLVGAESYSTTLAGGTLLTSKDWLHEIGGWSPVPRGVDRAVLAGTRRCGGRSYRTHGFQYVLRRRAGDTHTWAVSDEEFMVGKFVRRQGLDLGFADVEPVGDPDMPAREWSGCPPSWEGEQWVLNGT